MDRRVRCRRWIFGLALVAMAASSSLIAGRSAVAKPLAINTSAEAPFSDQGLVGVSKDGNLAAFWLFDSASAVFNAEKVKYAKKHDDIEPLAVEHLVIVDVATGAVAKLFLAVYYEIPNFAVTNGYPGYKVKLAAEANRYLREHGFVLVNKKAGVVKGKPGLRRIPIGSGHKRVDIAEAELMKKLKRPGTLVPRKSTP